MTHGHMTSPLSSAPTLRGLLGLFVLLGLLFTSAALAADPIGKLIVAAGKIEARAPDGSVRRLRRHAEIYKGDTLVTGGNVFAQIRFKDGALVALRPDTEFTIQDYRFDGAEDGTERAFFKLIKGGFRTITGAIGHKNKKNYQVSTPVATIGIRGTHYGVRQVTPELAAQHQQQGGDSLRPGLYGGVVDGEIAVGNAGGQQNFGNDRYFYIADARTPPESLLAPPGVVFDEDQPTDDEEQADDAGDGEEQAAEQGDEQTDTQDGEQAADETADQASDDAGGEQDGTADTADDGTSDTSDTGTDGDATDTGGDTGAGTGTDTGADTGTGTDTATDTNTDFTTTVNPDTTSLGSTTLPTTDLSTDTDSVFTSNADASTESVLTRAPSGAGAVIGFLNSVDGNSIGLVTSVLNDDGTDTHSLFYDTGSASNVQLKQANTQSTNQNNVLQTHTFSFGSATLVEGGLHSASGASWGRWSGDFVITSDGANDSPLSDLHYVYSASQAAQSSITGASSRAEPIIKYDLVDSAHTQPTDLNGNTGSYEYFIIGINYSTQRLVGYEFKTTISGATFEVALDSEMDLSEVVDNRSAQLSGTCSGCGGNSSLTLTGDGSIMFIDDALNYLGAGFAVRDNSRTYGIAGAGVLEQLLTRTEESNAAGNSLAHLAFITSDNNGALQREVHGLKEDGSNDSIKTATVNSIGNVVISATENFNNTTNKVVFESKRADLTDTGGNSVGVNWGRWTDGWNAQIAGTGTGSAGHAHFIYSDQLTSTTPSWTTATFNRIGGTSPTDENGNVADSVSANMSVNLTSMAVTAFNLDVGFSNTTGRSWSLSQGTSNTATVSTTTAPMAQVSLSGTCTGCATTSASGNATVDFIGANADYAISAFGASTSTNAEQMVGTMLMQR